MPWTGQAHLSPWFLMLCNMGKQCPRAPQIFIYISQKKKIAQTEGRLCTYLSESEEDVQNSPQEFSHNQSRTIHPLCNRLHRSDHLLFFVIYISTPLSIVARCLAAQYKPELHYTVASEPQKTFESTDCGCPIKSHRHTKPW